jgi:site-specific DNA-methyltransferase (adenine-specific)
MKPYYQDEYITLYCGDCREIVPTLGQFDLLLTDPPYVMLNINWDKQDVFFDFIDLLPSVMNEKSNIIFTGFGLSAYKWCVKVSEKYDFKEEIIWDKRYVGSPMNAVPRTHETIYLFGSRPLNKIRIPYEESQPDGKKIFNDFRRICDGFNGQFKEQLLKYLNTGEVAYSRVDKGGNGLSKSTKTKKVEHCIQSLMKVQLGSRPQSIITVANVHFKKNHPTQKPQTLFEILIKIASNPKETILDPFAGSGTTGVAAKRLNRKCTLIEKEEKYCEIAARRLSQGVLPLWEMQEVE